MVFRTRAAPGSEAPPMDVQTVVSLCAIFTVVLEIIEVSQRR